VAEVHRIRNQRDAEREASVWHARLNADEISAADRAEFETWRAAYPQNARAFDDVSTTWRRLLKSGPMVRAVSFGQAMDAAANPPSSVRPWLLGAAAAILLGVSVLVGIYWWQGRNETFLKTEIGETASVSLPDGSNLELNSNSVAKVQFDPHRRVIRLERGEAFFKVAHDAQRPFWVVAGPSWVRAVGTAFNVYLRPTDVEVTVSEGVIKVSAGRAKHEIPSDDALITETVSILKAGDQVDIGGPAATIRALSSSELNRSVAWRQGSLYFEDRPLAEVIQEMSRYTPLQVRIEDPSLGKLPIGGTFRANPQGAEALLTMLRVGLGLQVRREGQDRVLINRRPDQQR